MKSTYSISLLTVAMAWLIAPLSSRADSLFDAHGARTPSIELQSVLGPKSAGIRYDKRMIHAAQIAADRAHKHSTSRCWHWVKSALVDAQVVSSRPTTAYAKEAGTELQSKY